MKADLHVHSTASDGTLTPESLVSHAAEAAVALLALTDHDSVSGVAEAERAGRAAGVDVIPAVELSAVHGSLDVHILAYFVDIEDPSLLAHLADLRAARARRAEAMVKALADAGYDVGLENVLALSGGGSVGRSHVARALVGAGHAEDVGDAFRRLIGRGRPFYVAKDGRSPKEVVDRILEVGGIPVLAHPGVTRADALIPELVKSGLRGLEAYHADHDESQRRRYAALAAELGLLVTGGSDYHDEKGPGPGLGSVYVPESAIDELLVAGGR